MKIHNLLFIIDHIRSNADSLVTEELKKRGITGIIPTHGEIMGTLFNHDKIPMKEIGFAINRKKNTVTTLVDKLKKHGFVSIKQDKKDKRISLVSLTEKGEALRQDFYEISFNLYSKIYKDIPFEKRTALIETLNIINQNLEE